MSKELESIRARHAELQAKLDRLGRHAGLIESAQRAHDDRGELLGLLDRLTAVTSDLDEDPWRIEKPDRPGKWRLSIHPDQRPGIVDCPAVIVVHVDSAGGATLPGFYVTADNALLVGAKWQRIEQVADPFACPDAV